MEDAAPRNKHLRRLYDAVAASRGIGGGRRKMVGLALVLFIALFGFGHEFIGWADPHGQVKLGLFMSFLFGIVCGYKSRE
jgi:hypothetical protein